MGDPKKNDETVVDESANRGDAAIEALGAEGIQDLVSDDTSVTDAASAEDEIRPFRDDSIVVSAEQDAAAYDEFLAERGALADAIVEPLTVDEAVRALIGALQHDEEFIRAIEIRANGSLRILGNDNSARSVRFEALKRKPVGR